MTLKALGTVNQLALRQHRTVTSKILGDSAKASETNVEMLKSEIAVSKQATDKIVRETYRPGPNVALLKVGPASTPNEEEVRVTKFDRLYSSWSEFSGEVELNRLKTAVAECSTRFDDAIRLVSTKRVEVDDANRLHDETQKRYSHLMMKRDHWDALDASHFVQVTSEEVQGRQRLQSTRESLRKAEDDAGRYQRDYMDAMRQRYHEEQIWQEKWRVAGTFGTWSLIGLNIIIFTGGQYFHIRREKGRLQIIQDLINSKIPSPVVVAGEESEQNPNGVVQARHSGEVATATENGISNQIGAQIPYKEERQVSRNAHHIIQYVQNWLSSTKDSCQKAFNHLNLLSAKKASDEIHWPSAAAGAAVASTGFVIIAIFSRR